MHFILYISKQTVQMHFLIMYKQTYSKVVVEYSEYFQTVHHYPLAY